MTHRSSWSVWLWLTHQSLTSTWRLHPMPYMLTPHLNWQVRETHNWHWIQWQICWHGNAYLALCTMPNMSMGDPYLALFTMPNLHFCIKVNPLDFFWWSFQPIRGLKFELSTNRKSRFWHNAKYADTTSELASTRAAQLALCAMPNILTPHLN